MRRGDLDGRRSPLFHVRRVRRRTMGISLFSSGSTHMAAVQVGIARIGRVDGDRRIAEHRLGAGRRQLPASRRSSLTGYSRCPEMPGFFPRIRPPHPRWRCCSAGTRLTHAVAAVDPALFRKGPANHVQHGFGTALVHRGSVRAASRRSSRAFSAGRQCGCRRYSSRPRRAPESLHAPASLWSGPSSCICATTLASVAMESVVGAGHPQSGIALHALVADQVYPARSLVPSHGPCAAGR